MIKMSARSCVKTRTLAIIAGTMVALLLFLFAPSSRRPEPRHKSRSISYWVQGIKLPNRDTDRFVNTVLDIGPSAVPFLVKEFNKQNSVLRRSGLYRRIWAELPETLRWRVSAPVNHGGKMAALAYTLGMIGPGARDAVPSLIRAANDNSKTVPRNQCGLTE